MKVSVALTTLVGYMNRSGAGCGGLDIGVTECMYRSGAGCGGLDKGVTECMYRSGADCGGLDKGRDGMYASKRCGLWGLR